MTYEQAISGLGKNPAIKLAFDKEIENQGVNVAQTTIDNEAKTKKATGIADVQGGTVQKIGSAAGTLEDILKQAKPLVSSLSPTQIQAVNDAWQKGLKSVKGDATATKFLTYMGEARGKYKQVLALGNAPGDSEDKTAGESIGRGLTPEGYEAMQEAVNFAANSTVKRLGGKGYAEPSQATAQPTDHVSLAKAELARRAAAKRK